MASIFIKSAADKSGYPVSKLPEVGFVGHSNAGKSTLINALTKTKKLARVSQSPGKTDLLNFYNIDERFILVDMPGYGYAARGHAASESWAPMIEEYLKNRDNLRGVVLVLDVARKWSQDERNLIDWLNHHGIPALLAINKIDKLNQKELSAKKREFDKITGIENRSYISAEKGLGVEALLRTVFDKFLRV